jgi:sulfoxide reductase heme-binding subunit YedZ
MAITLPLPLPPLLRDFHPPKWLKPAAIFASGIPLIVIAGAVGLDMFTGSHWLGRNPIKEAEHMTGEWALRMLIITLAVTPLRAILGWNWLQSWRKMLGLWAFWYAVAHLMIWAGLDVEFDWAEIAKDLTKRWYIIVGMAALLLMVPLAITSTRGWVKKLGKRWVTLHKLIYVSVVLGLIHFFLSVKKDIEDPLMFAGFAAVLLAFRVWRRSVTRSASAATVRA